MGAEDPKYKRFSDIAKTKIEWLWYPYIPFGKICVLQGDPGCGKSLLMMNIIAKATRGEPLPDGRRLVPINVIYQCSEDGIEDTIKPRLEWAGADCERVSCINEDIITLMLVPSQNGAENDGLFCRIDGVLRRVSRGALSPDS